MQNSLKPQLALVLGSGGVRSIAALGVAEVLWREGIAPDLIVGCSAGAMFGALGRGSSVRRSHRSKRRLQLRWSRMLKQSP